MKENYTNLAFEYIKEQIISNQIMPGSVLREAELADRLHMSRTPVRAALAKLEKEGFITLQPYRGAIVNAGHLSVTGIVERIQFFKISLLALSRYLRKKKITIKIETAEKLYEDMGKALSDDNSDNFYELQFAMYRAFFLVFPNEYFNRIIQRTLKELYQVYKDEIAAKKFSFSYISAFEYNCFPKAFEALVSQDYDTFDDIVEDFTTEMTMDRVLNHQSEKSPGN